MAANFERKTLSLRSSVENNVLEKCSNEKNIDLKDNDRFERKYHTKLLRVMLDMHLSWMEHINVQYNINQPKNPFTVSSKTINN